LKFSYYFVHQINVCIAVPGILSQLGPDSLASLRKLAEAYQQAQAQGGAGAEDDDEIPELVENFDKAEVSETAEEKAE
jgi:nascent polypeptide-associated complex subunit beta